MNKLKIVILSIFVFVLSGCTTTYELSINNNQFSEKITTYIYNGDREKATFDDEATASRIDAFVERDVYPYFESYKNIYDKKVNKKSDYEQVILKYKFDDEEYVDSNALNLCFENKKIEISEDYYNIDLSGYFYCLYDNDVFDIVIKTNNKVFEHNSDENTGNKYVWHVNKSNFKNININMKLSKQNDKNKFYIIGISLIAFIFVSIIIFFIRKRTQNSNVF